ncbi:winged helix-turn-helix transcriptional regulator [Gordonia soli]|uniref:Putative HxlR family transcriptional regulator n=1 Tax=Gordonia soli NBRC 108243 TaxID=1223545 RepID=M0QLX8_9ACTN|nr:helix-turn-helix domain-containing protein [Gordonia soli]GAC68382.1 putative HxlR family transcriptional regulator [Gordonia soli NBRC 108243]
MTTQERTRSTPGHSEVTDPALCPTRRLLDHLGTRWTALVVKILAAWPQPEMRYSDLRRSTVGISAKMLAQTLREMEQAGLVHRRVEPTTPPRVHYSLTSKGRSLEELLVTVRSWAQENMATA